MNKINVFLLPYLCLIACGSNSPASPEPYTPKYIEPNDSVDASSDGSTSAVIDSEPLVIVDAGTDAPINEPIDSPDASSDSDAQMCEGSMVVGHCLFNMATTCQEYSSDHSTECTDLSVHPMGGTWYFGPCGNEIETDLSRSSGGCVDECGSIRWSYPLGGRLPTEDAIQAIKDQCTELGLNYISVGF